MELRVENEDRLNRMRSFLRVPLIGAIILLAAWGLCNLWDRAEEIDQSFETAELFYIDSIIVEGALFVGYMNGEEVYWSEVIPQYEAVWRGHCDTITTVTR